MEISRDVADGPLFVIHGYAGIQKINKWIVENLAPRPQDWIPAFAGMTGCSHHESAKIFGNHYIPGLAAQDTRSLDGGGGRDEAKTD